METIRTKIKKIRKKAVTTKRYTISNEAELWMEEIITECDVITRMVERIQTLNQKSKEIVG